MAEAFAEQPAGTPLLVALRVALRTAFGRLSPEKRELEEVRMELVRQVPELAAIQARLTKLWNYERYRTPFKQGGRYFYSKNDGLQNQNVLYTLTSLDATPAVLLDPNTLSADGTVALAGIAVSDDWNLLAYGLATAGSDWQEWKVRDVQTGTDLSDQVKWVKFSGASWTKDGGGFFYSRYPEPKVNAGETFAELANQRLYYHKLASPQSADRLVAEEAIEIVGQLELQPDLRRLVELITTRCDVHCTP
jgi:prolyl oligopeptidase